jgi:UDP-N-acetyl-D-glucosamine dehydrogenase
MIHDRTAVVGLIGLGYVGLPLAVEAGKAGLNVISVDVDPRKVDAINEARSYIPDGKSEDVAALRAAGKLEATLDYAALQFADAVSICVPTPLGKTRDRDMS